MNNPSKGEGLGCALNVLGSVVGAVLYCAIPAAILLGITAVFGKPEVGVFLVALVGVPVLAFSIYTGWTDPVRTRAQRRAARAEQARRSEASAW